MRVRILIDDMLTAGSDWGMRAADAHPNVELRMFNAFGRRRWRLLDGVTSFQRVNRRMHNKSFTVDNQASVIGGRNIADEYFAAAEDVNFGELDVRGVGPVVREVSDMFDSYWNHERSLPAPAVTGPAEDPEAEVRQLRDALGATTEGARDSRYGEALTSTILDATTGERGALTWCPYELVYDSPDKSMASRPEGTDSILSPLRASIAAARTELLIVSPYFVLLKDAREQAGELIDRGVRLRVITNSLAANNQKAVHSGYMSTRRALLRMGAEIWEVGPDAGVAGVDRAQLGESRSTLHTKAYAVDREHLFLGSFNFDPRSAYINTEMGIILSAPELVRRVVEGVDREIEANAWRVQLDERGRLVWTGLREGRTERHHSEPKTGLLQRCMVRFLALLPIKGQL